MCTILNPAAAAGQPPPMAGFLGNPTPGYPIREPVWMSNAGHSAETSPELATTWVVSAAATAGPANRPATTSPAATSSRPTARPVPRVSELVRSTINRSFLCTSDFNHNRIDHDCVRSRLRSITTAFDHTTATSLTPHALTRVNNRTHPGSTASTLGDIAHSSVCHSCLSSTDDRTYPDNSGIPLAKETKRMIAIASRLLCGAVFPLGAPVTTRSWTRVTAIARDQPRAFAICPPCVIACDSRSGTTILLDVAAPLGVR